MSGFSGFEQYAKDLFDAVIRTRAHNLPPLVLFDAKTHSYGSVLFMETADVAVKLTVPLVNNGNAAAILVYLDLGDGQIWLHINDIAVINNAEACDFALKTLDYATALHTIFGMNLRVTSGTTPYGIADGQSRDIRWRCPSSGFIAAALQASNGALEISLYGDHANVSVRRATTSVRVPYAPYTTFRERLLDAVKEFKQRAKDLIATCDDVIGEEVMPEMPVIEGRKLDG